MSFTLDFLFLNDFNTNGNTFATCIGRKRNSVVGSRGKIKPCGLKWLCYSIPLFVGCLDWFHQSTLLSAVIALEQSLGAY